MNPHTTSEASESPETREQTQETVTLDTKRRAFRTLIDTEVRSLYEDVTTRPVLRGMLVDAAGHQQGMNQIQQRLMQAIGSDHPVLERDDVEELLGKFVKHINALVGRLFRVRIKLEKQARAQIMRWFDMSSMGINALDVHIERADSTTLEGVRKHIYKAREFLESHALSTTRRDASQIFRGWNVDIQALSSETQSQIEDFMNTGVISEDALAEILAASTTTSAHKRAMIAYFLPFVSLRFLKEQQYLTDDQVNTLTQRAFERFVGALGVTDPANYLSSTASKEERRLREQHWRDFSQDMQDRIEEGIPTDDLSDETIEAFFQEDSPARALLARKIAQHTEDHSRMEASESEALGSLADVVRYVQEKIEPSYRGKIDPSLERLHSGQYIVSYHGSDALCWKVEEDATHAGVCITGYDAIGTDMGARSMSYGTFALNLLKEIRLGATTRIEATDVPTHVSLSEGVQFSGREDFEAAISQVDRANAHLGLAEGLAFTMQFGGHTYYFRVQDISDDTKEITIQDAQENVRTLTWAEFLEAVSHSERKFARFGEIASAENFVKHAGISGLGYKDGQITFGKNGKGKDVPLWGFKHTEAKEYLRVVQKGSRVSLVRMRVDKNAPLGEKSGKEVIREEKVLRGNMLTLEFLKEYLENEGFTEPYNHDPIRNPKKYHDTGELPPGAEEPQWQKRRSLFSGWANVGALIAAVKMGKEMIEHKMEEKQRLQAAEFFYNMSQTLGKEGSDWALQAMSQFAGSIGEMVDKRISKLEQLSAEPRRKEIRKILLTKPPKPFDIMAAMTVTVKMSGHLYPDSALQDLQGHNYLWFRQLCESLGYDYNTELQKAIKKEREENSTTAEHIHETTLITRFLKANSGKNPYIQAFRGGSKYWGAVVEGRNGQIEKGEREVKERAKPGDRKTYIMAKYKSNELEIVVGAFPELWGADASPQYLSPAFVWTMSNATRIAHPELLQKFKKGNVYGKGLNFHAAQFGEDNREAKMYQSAVAAIVKYLSRPGGPLAGTQALEELNSLARVRDSAPDSHRPELYEDLSKFWERYQHALHPVLQGTSPDLFLASQSALLSEEEKTAIQEYTKKMSITTAVAMEQFSKDLLKYDGYAHDSNFIFSTAPGDAHVSLALQLKKFKIETDHIAIDSDQAHLWNGSILKYLDSIRTDPVFSSNPEYRKTQFAVTHQEIMQFIARSFTTMARLDPEHWDVVVKKQVYLQDLVKRGFDLSFDNVFHGGEHNRYNVDMVYPRFLSGGISATASAQMTQSGIQSRVREAMNFGGGSWSEAANDAEIRRRA